MVRRGVAGAALASILLVAPASAAAAPFVHVDDAELARGGDGATITAVVTWDRSAATGDQQMGVGDLRAVAVSDRGHRPTLLAEATYTRIAQEPRQRVRLTFSGADRMAAIRRGNRVVLTATQHMDVVGLGVRSERSYVTVATLQPFRTPQDRIGRKDCSDRPVEPGAQLSRCDLVGADLDGAHVSERYPRSQVTRMLLADLTGASLRGADLTGDSIAGGRINGADATGAIVDNLSLASTEAVGLIAREVTSDVEQGSAGANLFAADLRDADFRDATLNGVSFGRARLDGADFRGSTWGAVEAEGTDFRGADLREVTSRAPKLSFANLTDAQLRGATFLPVELTWATLCHTTMPDASMDGDADRDCRSAVDPGPKPVAAPFVVVRGELDRERGRVTISGTIRWNDAGRSGGSGMTAGDVRAVAIDGSTGRATRIASMSIAELDASTSFRETITDAAKRAALRPGNRVVLTATQHPPFDDGDPRPTSRSYVTVDTLQAGPGRGRVGSVDCSDQPLVPGGPAATGYTFCDLPGAALAHADLSGAPMIKADLSGADLAGAALTGIRFDGAAMGSVVAAGASFTGITMVEAVAPELDLSRTRVSGQMRAKTLDDADFREAVIVSTTFAVTPMRRARFSGATLDSVDLGFTRLGQARLDRVRADTPSQARPNSLFMADLTGATLEGGRWGVDESGEIPWTWSTLCRTTMPSGDRDDRDCPK